MECIASGPVHRSPRPCRASSQSTASSSGGAEAAKRKSIDLHELDVDTLHDRLELLLDEQWLKAGVDHGIAPTPVGNTTFNKVKHVVGGFSVVVRMPEEGLAYRLQPMRSVKAGLTWVAFYMMLQEAAADRYASAEAAAADVLFRPDRSVVLGTNKYKPLSVSSRKLAWEHLQIAQEFQGERLRKATKRLVYFRHQLLKTSIGAYQQGLCTSAENCPISWTDGGVLQPPCVTNGLMFPSHWFWIQVGNPAQVSDLREDTEDDAQDAAQSHGDLLE